MKQSWLGPGDQILGHQAMTQSWAMQIALWQHPEGPLPTLCKLILTVWCNSNRKEGISQIHNMVESTQHQGKIVHKACNVRHHGMQGEVTLFGFCNPQSFSTYHLASVLAILGS